ncbi:hypothetical protein J3E64_003133 [Sphingobium sp. OAS761]|uniref:hypothetical protein n=1 Tax=Sphingobium sp. OAS761 TaxID=2817901 RepID=UPI00209E9CD3|nr:hypothetical protein [Sphingobium sp. OAS761]MCP1471426.1 hypothetical protein [Sphingobium sp. OAS761]
MDRAAVDLFISAITAGKRADIESALAPDVQVAVFRRNPSAGTENMELATTEGRTVTANQIALVDKRIKRPKSYICVYEKYFASCRSQVARGAGASILGISTNGRGVSSVRISYATFDEMYKAYVGK